MPESQRQIAFARPCLDEQEADAARRAILSGWVTQGPEVAAFEKEFAAQVGAPYACAVSSCTAALHLALRAVGVASGDEVITVSHSYVATAAAVRYLGALPVFVDIDPTTYNIDPDRITDAITDRTRAILCVHQMGMPCDLKRILTVAREHGLAVVEDAACAVGSEVRIEDEWERIGRPHGDVACFSFHPRKLITTGDGGMITTSGPAIDEAVRLWRQHGMSVPDLARHGSREVIFESYPERGYNYRMTDIVAAVGRVQLHRLDQLVARRREQGERYASLLARMPGLTPPHEPEYARTNWQSYCVRLPEGCDQRAVMQHMLDRGISTRRGVMCAHREAPYADLPSRRPLGESERAQDRCVLLPLHHELSEDDQAFVVAALDEACRTAAGLTVA